MHHAFHQAFILIIQARIAIIPDGGVRVVRHGFVRQIYVSLTTPLGAAMLIPEVHARLLDVHLPGETTAVLQERVDFLQLQVLFNLLPVFSLVRVNHSVPGVLVKNNICVNTPEFTLVQSMNVIL